MADRVKQKEETEYQHGEFVRWIDSYLDGHRPQLDDMERVVAFYNHRQWSDKELSVMEARNQPPTVYNILRQNIEELLGDEMRKRVDVKALPRTSKHEDAVHVVEDAIRFVHDEAGWPQKKSRWYEDLLVPGHGGILVEPEFDKVERPGEDGGIALQVADIHVRLRGIRWDRLAYDPHSSENDCSDAKWVGFIDYMDLADLRRTYVDGARSSENAEAAEEALTAAMSASNGSETSEEPLEDRPKHWCDPERKRARRAVIYFTEDGGKNWMTTHVTGTGFLARPKLTGLLSDHLVPRHICPLVVRRAHIDENNHCFGEAKGQMGPQEDYNKRRSKSLADLIGADVTMEKGAVPSATSVRSEVSKSVSVFEVNKGKNFDVRRKGDLSEGQLAMMQEARGELSRFGARANQDQSDVNVSPTVVLQRQRAATLKLEPLFDVLRSGERQVNQHIWYTVRQFWTQEKFIRVRDDEDRNGFRFVGLNRVMRKSERVREHLEDGVDLVKALEFVDERQLAASVRSQEQRAAGAAQQGEPIDLEQIRAQIQSQVLALPQMNAPFKANEIESLGVDVVLETTPDTQVLQQEQFVDMVRLAELSLKLTGEQAIPFEVLVEMSGVRDKRRILDMFEKAKQPDPEAVAEQQKAKQLQEALLQTEVQRISAETQQSLARAKESEAKAQKMLAEIQALAEELRQNAVKVGAGAEHDTARAALAQAKAAGLA